LAPDAPGGDVVDVVELDFGRVVVVVLAAADLGRVVVVVVLEARGFGGVPRDDGVVEPRTVVVVVDDLVAGRLAAGLVVVVVDAFGTFGSSLAGASSRAWAGPPATGGGGDPGGGGIRSSRRAYCMIRAKTGADTWPP
jgi:hypothetical protein